VQSGLRVIPMKFLGSIFQHEKKSAMT